MSKYLVALALVALSAAGAARADYQLVTVAEGLDNPWSLAFLPDGGYLVTERTGALRRITPDGAVSPPLAGVPDSYFAGQGGLLEVMLHPDFPSNQLVYLSYAHGDLAANATRIARGRLGADGLSGTEVIFTASPTKDTPQHYGGKLAFMPDGTLLLTTGDGFDYREEAQNIDSNLGKTIRINADGGIPPDNPFVERGGPGAAVWSYGHRNPQGLIVDPATGIVYQHEHGPRGGDELNRIEPGHNYGWPAICWGIDYSGAGISPFTELPGMEQPLTYWVPSIAPSGLAIYHGERFPEWEGDLFVGALVNREVRRLEMEDGKVVAEHAMFSELGERIRDVRVSPDGYLYLVTDGAPGKVIRVERER